MLDVKVVDSQTDNVEVEVGQIRYNDRGMFVLITHGAKGLYDALVLKNENANSRVFDWNSRGQSGKVMAGIYPYIAKGELKITK